MNANRNRETVLRFYEALNHHDVDAIGNCLATDNVAHCASPTSSARPDRTT